MSRLGVACRYRPDGTGFVKLCCYATGITAGGGCCLVKASLGSVARELRMLTTWVIPAITRLSCCGRCVRRITRGVRRYRRMRLVARLGLMSAILAVGHRNHIPA